MIVIVIGNVIFCNSFQYTGFQNRQQQTPVLHHPIIEIQSSIIPHPIVLPKPTPLINNNPVINPPSPSLPSPLQVEVEFFTSSHGKGLPKPLKKIRFKHPWCRPFRNSSFDCLGGRGFGEPEVRAMVAKIRRAIGPTVFVMINGSNPLRHSGHYSQVYQPYRRVLEYARPFDHVHIVIVSIIPSVRKDTRKRFAKCSVMLKNLTKLFKNSSFLNMNKMFCPDGLLVPKYFESTRLYPNGREVNVHLSQKYGFPLLAQSIMCHIARCAKAQFSN